jgi:hypothetical protein
MSRNTKPNTVSAISVMPYLLFVAGWLLTAVVALTLAAQAG